MEFDGAIPFMTSLTCLLCASLILLHAELRRRLKVLKVSLFACTAYFLVGPITFPHKAFDGRTNSRQMLSDLT